MLAPFMGLPEKAVEKLTAIYDEAKPYLNAAEAAEVNHIECMGNLYRRPDRFPGELKRKAKSFMDHCGTISDPPEELAAFLEEFATAIAPHLNWNDGGPERRSD